MFFLSLFGILESSQSLWESDVVRSPHKLNNAHKSLGNLAKPVLSSQICFKAHENPLKLMTNKKMR